MSRNTSQTIIKAEPIVRYVQEEPRERGSCEEHSILWDSEVAHEVAEAGLLDLQALVGLLGRGNARELVDIGLATLASDVVFGVLVGLFHISGDIKGVAGSFRDSEAVC